LPGLVREAWTALLLLRWVIDGLHWTYHRGCRDPTSSWFVDGVDPSGYPELKGVDTEGAEQIFHIANRWQVILSNASPVHQEILLLLFAREHNRNHSCSNAIRKYRVAQERMDVETPPPPVPDDAECQQNTRRRRKKKRVLEPGCGCGAAGQGAADSCVAEPAAESTHRAEVRPLVQRWAVLNPSSMSKTVHSVVLQRDVYTECGWCFQGRAETAELGTFRGKSYPGRLCTHAVYYCDSQLH
jgi:hypothetical protein